MLYRKVTFERLKFLLENLNKNVEVVAYVYEDNCKVVLKIGSIFYEIKEKNPIFVNKSNKFYKIIRFLTEKNIKKIKKC